MKHGYGIFVKQESQFCYAGFWLNNEPHGYGILRAADGSVYEGKFRFGVKEGTGQERWPDGRKYIGHYRQGLFDGNGSLWHPSGEKYVGNFVKGKMHGQGNWIIPKLIHSDRRLINLLGDETCNYDGNLVDGKVSGVGNETWSSGGRYEG